jgi:hypothetical protein
MSVNRTFILFGQIGTPVLIPIRKRGQIFISPLELAARSTFQALADSYHVDELELLLDEQLLDELLQLLELEEGR